VTTVEAELPSSSPRVALRLPDRPVAAGEYLVRVAARPRGGGAVGTTETVRIRVPEGQARALDATPQLFRRGPFTGPAFQPTADLRFRRAERLRAELPLEPSCDSVTARLLDRNGQPLAVPASGALGGEAGRRVATAELALAPLAPADYLLEIAAVCRGAAANRLVAFRTVP
jgi:hypothetical protein